MPLEQPSASNGYALHPDHKMNVTFWQTILSELHARLQAREALEAEFESLLATGPGTAYAIIQDTLEPTLVQYQAEVLALQDAIALAEDRLAALQSGGVFAENVPVAVSGRFEANTSAQEAFEQLDVALEAVEDALPGLVTAIAAVEPPQRVNVVSANATLVAGKAYRVGAAGITLTLPATPVVQQTIRIVDGGVLSYLATATVARNGKTIMGLAENLILNMTGADLLIWYDGTTWRLF